MHLLLLFACWDNETSASVANVSVRDSIPVQDSDSVPVHPSECTATALVQFPVDGSGNVSLDTEVYAEFSESVTEADFLIAGVKGHSELASDGLSVHFYPDTPLRAGAALTTTLVLCGASTTATFQTVSPLQVNVTGNTYVSALDESDIRWVEPAGLGPVLLSFFTTKFLLFSVERQTMDTLEMVGMAGIKDAYGVHPYACVEPIVFPPVSFEANPSFQMPPTDANLFVSGVNIPVYDLYINGTFSPDGRGILDARIGGLVDTRPIIDLMGMDMCDATPCVSCPDGRADCLRLEVEDPWLERLSEVGAEQNGGDCAW